MAKRSKRSLGRLRHRVTIQQIGRTADGAGGYARDDTPGATVWAEVKLVNAFERFQYQQLQKDITHKVRIRSRSDIEHVQRLTWGSKTLYVESVADPFEDSRPGEWLVLACREGGLD